MFKLISINQDLSPNFFSLFQGILYWSRIHFEAHGFRGCDSDGSECQCGNWGLSSKQVSALSPLIFNIILAFDEI